MDMNTPEQILAKVLVRERELDRIRTRSLARQQWAAVIEVEARLDECKRLRTKLTEESTSNEHANNIPKA